MAHSNLFRTFIEFTESGIHNFLHGHSKHDFYAVLINIHQQLTNIKLPVWEKWASVKPKSLQILDLLHFMAWVTHNHETDYCFTRNHRSGKRGVAQRNWKTRWDVQCFDSNFEVLNEQNNKRPTTLTQYKRDGVVIKATAPLTNGSCMLYISIVKSKTMVSNKLGKQFSTVMKCVRLRVSNGCDKRRSLDGCLVSVWTFRVEN